MRARGRGSARVGDGVHQMGLAEAGAAVDEERVVGLGRASATATAAACANRLLEPMTKVSKVYLGLSRAWVGRGAPGSGPGGPGGPKHAAAARPAHRRARPGQPRPGQPRPGRMPSGPPPCPGPEPGGRPPRAGRAGPPGIPAPGRAACPGPRARRPSSVRQPVPDPGRRASPRRPGPVTRGRPGDPRPAGSCRSCRRGAPAWPSWPAPWHRRAGIQVGRKAARGDRGGVHRHRQLDAAAQFPGQRVGDQRPQPGLQLFLHELIRRGDERRVLDQPERPGQLEPGPLVRPICMVASSSRDRAHTSARSVSLIDHSPLAPPSLSTQCDQQLCPQVVHAGYRGVHGSRGKNACGRDPRARLRPPPAGALSTA